MSDDDQSPPVLDTVGAWALLQSTIGVLGAELRGEPWAGSRLVTESDRRGYILRRLGAVLGFLERQMDASPTPAHRTVDVRWLRAEAQLRRKHRMQARMAQAEYEAAKAEAHRLWAQHNVIRQPDGSLRQIYGPRFRVPSCERELLRLMRAMERSRGSRIRARRLNDAWAAQKRAKSA